MIITKTPFRMSFFGGGTDMENYFKENGGAVLSTTFDKYCYVTVRHLPPFFDRLHLFIRTAAEGWQLFPQFFFLIFWFFCKRKCRLGGCVFASFLFFFGIRPEKQTK